MVLLGVERVRPKGRSATLAIANVLLGAAIGLGGYQTVTDVTAWWEQRALAAEASVAGIEVPDRLLPGEANVLDFEGWEAEDLRYWETLPPGGVFGRILAGKMGLDAVVVKGTSRADLKKGPGWIEWTDLPGPKGNVGIAGHRTTFGAPFRRLDTLAAGDTIELYSRYRRYVYVVTEQLVVTPDRTDVVASTEEPMLTLTACHPPYSARYRLIVRAELVDARRMVPSEPDD